MCEIAGNCGGENPFLAGPQGHHVAHRDEGAASCHGHWGFTFCGLCWGGLGGSQPLFPLPLLHFNCGGGRKGTSPGMLVYPDRGLLWTLLQMQVWGGSGWGNGPGPLLLPLSLLYKANFFGTVLTKASKACNRCAPLLFTSFFFFFFLNKLVLTSISQCSDACLVFGSRIFSADGGEAVYTQTPNQRSVQEGAGHGKATVPFNFLLCSI